MSMNIKRQVLTTNQAVTVTVSAPQTLHMSVTSGSLLFKQNTPITDNNDSFALKLDADTTSGVNFPIYEGTHSIQIKALSACEVQYWID